MGWLANASRILGITTEDGITYQVALEQLQVAEEALAEAREHIITESLERAVYVEENELFETARQTVYFAALKIYHNLLNDGVSSDFIPRPNPARPIPKSIVTGASRFVTLDPIVVHTNLDGAFGATVLTNSTEIPNGPELVGAFGTGALGAVPVLTVIPWAGAILAIAAVTVLVHYLTKLVHPEVALAVGVANAQVDALRANSEAIGAFNWACVESQEAGGTCEELVRPQVVSPSDIGGPPPFKTEAMRTIKTLGFLGLAGFGVWTIYKLRTKKA